MTQPGPTFRVVCLEGDGIGPEVMREAIRALGALPLSIEIDEKPFGGPGIRASGNPLPPETLAACLAADGVLLAAVGSPEYERADVRPEQGLLHIRSGLGVFANLRPVRADGVDVMIVRELSGGLYYGRKGRTTDGMAFDICEYHPWQIERIARRGFELAMGRRQALTVVDKYGVLETSKLWREVVDEVALDFPAVRLDAMLVDNAAMQLVRDPGRFDVLLTENTFGDILSDVAAVATGGVGLAPSASLGGGRARDLRADPRLRPGHRRARDREPGSDAALRRDDALVRAGPAGRGSPARRRRR